MMEQLEGPSSQRETGGDNSLQDLGDGLKEYDESKGIW